MLAAGLGMLASNSPNFGNAVGEGGLAGLKTYQQQSRSQQEQALAQRKIAAQADALKQRAAAAAENMRLRQEQQAAMVPYRQAQVENWRSLAAAREKQAATRDAIMGMITGNNGAPAAAPEMVAPQPQSMDAPLEVPQFQQTSAMEPVQGADPRLIKTAGEPSAVPSKTADMIDTPYGRMTRQEAMKKGGVMMLDPQFAAAGRALVDLAKGSDTPGLGKEATNKLEEKQLNTTEGLARLSNISSQFKPEYQTIENRLGFKWNELKDSVGFLQKSVSEPDRQKLAEFSAFRADALNNLNQYIKEITGAAMTNAEADRIMRAMPNPGDGVLNGDSPTVFKAKLDAAIRSSQMALARYNYLRRNGFSGSIDDMATKMPLQKMNDVIQNRTNELLQEAMSQNKGLKPADVAPIVKQRLRQEFGLEA